MKKFILFLRLYWGRLLIVIIGAGLLIGAGLYINYTYTNYLSLEDFTRRQISGMMAVYMPMFFFSQLFILPLYFAMYFYMMRGGGMGKVNVQKLGKNDIKIKWENVIGMEGAKKEAKELIKMMKDRSLVKAMGGKIIKGTLMIGPPGCGKTYLAKAIASECDLPMISAVGSEFVAMFVGQGAARMKNLFKEARALASLHGGCIIFIDEIDSFATPRSEDLGFGGTTSHNATINQFLTEMDGLRKSENTIMVIGATNFDEADLDAAIMRAGRMERKIHITRPNLIEREDLFKFYLSKVKTSPDVNATILARKTLWFTPADIDSMVREAGLVATREARDAINNKDLSEAYDRVSLGMKSNVILTKKEKLWTAYHETGHAIIGYLIHPTDDVVKASIVPRRGSLGLVYSRPFEELYCPDKNELLADVKVCVSAYVAERVKFGITTSGVGGGRGSDFYRAMQIAQRMVYSYGMGKSGLIGDFNAMADRAGHVAISEHTQRILDEDVQDILNTCIKDVEEILRKHMDLFEDFAQTLLQKEELEYDEIAAIFNKYGLKPLSRPTMEI